MVPFPNNFSFWDTWLDHLKFTLLIIIIPHLLTFFSSFVAWMLCCFIFLAVCLPAFCFLPLFYIQVGKAYFEMADLFEADRIFELARHATPYSLDGMDIYSTVLYVRVTFNMGSFFCFCLNFYRSTSDMAIRREGEA